MPLLVVAGPTASGKSALAVALARKFSGEIVACDSTQLYRGVNIGTAKPTMEERGGIAHHLIDVLDPAEAATAGGYRELALAALSDLTCAREVADFSGGHGVVYAGAAGGIGGFAAAFGRSCGRGCGRALKSMAAAHLHGVLRRMDREAAGENCGDG